MKPKKEKRNPRKQKQRKNERKKENSKWNKVLKMDWLQGTSTKGSKIVRINKNLVLESRWPIIKHMN